LICDVSPLGLRTAAKAGIPSVLIENFTWDWIYEGYEGQEDLQPFSRALAEIFSRAPYRIQTEPVCQTLPGATKVSPVSRYARSSRQEVRTKLGVRPDERIVLVTTGGMYGTLRFLDRLKQRSDLLFLIPSQEQQRRTDANIHYLPGHSDIYHPDLVNAVDLVVGKLGYSTVAEAFRFGRPMIATRRASFRESPVLEEFVSSRLPSLIIDEQDFQSGAWIPEIDHLFDRPVAKGGGDDGAESAARIILEIISGNQASRL
jgi:hypothetical protein